MICALLCVRLSIFLPHRHQLGFDLHIPRLKRHIQLPPDDPHALHPCLIDAICLGGCASAGLDFDAYARIFQLRTEEQMALALASADRLEDLLWAMVILGWHYIRKGNEVQAHSLANSKYIIIVHGETLTLRLHSCCTLGSSLWIELYFASQQRLHAYRSIIGPLQGSNPLLGANQLVVGYLLA